MATAANESGGWRLSTDLSLQNRERAVVARKNRQTQLKKWSQYDKHVDKDLLKTKKPGLPPGGKAAVDMVGSSSRSVTFGDNIVLLEAATREDYTEVRRLLTKGVSADVCNEDGLTPLHQCSIDNSIEMCRLLLAFKANVNAKDSENWTPLHAAATCGHTDLCKLLIDNGADLLSLNAEGNMPYDICDHEDTLDLIEREMATRNITQQQIDEMRLVPEKEMLKDMQQLATNNPTALYAYDTQGATPLHIAAANGFCEVAYFLCSKRVPVNTPDKDEWLPIHVAACWGHLDVIELLVSFGADLEARTKSGKGESVFDICEDPEMQERLRQIQQDQESLRRFPSRGLAHRNSSRNPRSSHCGSTSLYDSSSTIRERSSSLSASIRRTSIRDKSLTSWREAKQEAEIRMSKEMELQAQLGPGAAGDTGAPILLPTETVEKDIMQAAAEMSTKLKDMTEQESKMATPGITVISVPGITAATPTSSLNSSPNRSSTAVKTRPTSQAPTANNVASVSTPLSESTSVAQPEDVRVSFNRTGATGQPSIAFLAKRPPSTVEPSGQITSPSKRDNMDTARISRDSASLPITVSGQARSSTLTTSTASAGSERNLTPRQTSTLPSGPPSVGRNDLLRAHGLAPIQESSPSSTLKKTSAAPAPGNTLTDANKPPSANNINSLPNNRMSKKNGSSPKCCRII